MTNEPDRSARVYTRKRECTWWILVWWCGDVVVGWCGTCRRSGYRRRTIDIDDRRDDGFSLSLFSSSLYFSLLLLYFVVVDSSKRIGVGRKMAPKKDMLSAPLSSTTSVVARIIDAFAALALTVNAGNGQDVELSLQDGRKILEYPEILLERTWSSVSSSVSSVLDDDGMAPWGLYGMLVSSPRAPSRTKSTKSTIAHFLTVAYSTMAHCSREDGGDGRRVDGRGPGTGACACGAD